MYARTMVLLWPIFAYIKRCYLIPFPRVNSLEKGGGRLDGIRTQKALTGNAYLFDQYFALYSLLCLCNQLPVNLKTIAPSVGLRSNRRTGLTCFMGG